MDSQTLAMAMGKAQGSREDELSKTTKKILEKEKELSRQIASNEKLEKVRGGERGCFGAGYCMANAHCSQQLVRSFGR